MSRTATGAVLASGLAVIVGLGLGAGPQKAARGALGAQASLTPFALQVERISSIQDGMGRERRAAIAFVSAVAARNRPAAASRSASSGRGYLGDFVVTCYSLSGGTSTGHPVSTDVVAVDPSVIHYGSRISIAGVGTRTALDTGGAIRGHRLDIWLPSEAQCESFGVRRLPVYSA